MIRYKVILTQTSIVDAKDEQEAKDKVVDTFEFGNLDVYAEELHPPHRLPGPFWRTWQGVHLAEGFRR